MLTTFLVGMVLGAASLLIAALLPAVAVAVVLRLFARPEVSGAVASYRGPVADCPDPERSTGVPVSAFASLRAASASSSGGRNVS
jgi:hypothetical protein